jgi:two-component system response regulator YesN
MKTEKKYRAIIADDEPMVVRLIEMLGHWELLGIEIIDECSDGNAALESILKNRPDIVISDIKMPGCDGIQMIEQVRKQDQSVQFILLSGYRYFEYARSALRLNVADYLLKPVSEEQLNEILEKTCRMIDRMRQQETDGEQLKSYQTEEQKNRAENFAVQLLNLDRRVTEFLTEGEIEEQYNIRFPYACYQVLCIGSNLGEILGRENSVYDEKINALVKQNFSGEVETYLVRHYLYYVVIVNFNQEKTKEIVEASLAVYYGIRDLSELYGEFRLNIGCSNVKENSRDLIEAVREARAAELGHLVYWGNKVITQNQICQLPKFQNDQIVDKALMQNIEECVKYLRAEELGQIFSDLSVRASKYNNGNPESMLYTIDYMTEALRKMKLDRFELNVDECMEYAILNARNFQQFFKFLYGYLKNFIEEEQQKIDVKLSRPIEDAIYYIEKHYMDNISLESVAEEVNVSPSYLSRIFKEKKEIGFNDYLTNVRIGKSQELLINTNLTIKEISARTGYPDEKYYSKLFKKNIGIKPTEYRKLYG